MKFKRVIFGYILILVMLFSFTLKSFAKTDIAEDILSDYNIELSQDVTEILESLGFENFSAEELSKITLSDTFRAIRNIFTQGMTKPFASMFTLLGLVIMCAVANSFIQNNHNFSVFVNSVMTLFVAFAAFLNSVQCISDSVAAVYSAGILMKSLVPATAVLTALSGNPSMAISYNAVSMYCAEIITAICSDFLTPVLCAFSAIAVCLSVNSEYNSEALLNGVKKIIGGILGFAGTVYTGIISLKDILAVGIDKVSVKGAKFILGSTVPVVGSALSEGLSSVIAAISLMKNTYGVIGIIVIIAVTLPAICELTMWQLTFAVAGYAAQTMGLDGVAKALTSLKYVMTMMLSILLFIIYILIISAGMVILLGTK
ncbi:MAG: hypothetical protein J6Q94_09835 [Clostridia bacterium]|nr:hypothetical protein [Clostridia bacterium]